MKLETLFVELAVDATQFYRDITKVENHVQQMVDRTVKEFTKLHDQVAAPLKAVAKEIESNVTRPLQVAEIEMKQAAVTAETSAATIRSAMASTGGLKMGGGSVSVGNLNPFVDDIARMRTQLNALAVEEAKIAATATKAAAGTAKLAAASTLLSDAMLVLAAPLSFVSLEASAGALSIASLGSAALPVAAGLATFGGTLTATTFLLSGFDGVLQILPNSIEGAKLALYGLSAGYIDLTEATRMAKDGQQAIDNQLASSGELVRSMIAERQQMLSGLTSTVAGLADVSREAEEAFAAKFLGRLGQLGLTGGQLELGVSGNIGSAFAEERIKREIAAIEKQTEVYGKSARELAELRLIENGVSADTLNYVRSLYAKQDALKAVADAQREAAQAQRDAEREAKRAVEHAAREQQQIQDRLAAEAQTIRDSLHPEEKAAASIARINEMFLKGLLSRSDALAAVADIQQDLDKIMSPADQASKPIRHAHRQSEGVEAIAAGSIEAQVKLAAVNSLPNSISRIEPQANPQFAPIRIGPPAEAGGGFANRQAEIIRLLARIAESNDAIRDEAEDPFRGAEQINIEPAQLGAFS